MSNLFVLCNLWQFPLSSDYLFCGLPVLLFDVLDYHRTATHCSGGFHALWPAIHHFCFKILSLMSMDLVRRLISLFWVWYLRLLPRIDLSMVLCNFSIIFQTVNEDYALDNSKELKKATISEFLWKVTNGFSTGVWLCKTMKSPIMQISIIRIDDGIWARNNKQKATRFT